MSNINGGLVCNNDGSGTVTAKVSGTNVAQHAVVSLNGQDGRELGPGNHSYTLTATFPNGTDVYLNVQRDGGEKLLKVLKVDCPQPVATTTTTAPPVVSSNPPVTVPNSIVEQRVPRSWEQELPATGDNTVPGALAAGGIILAGAFLICAGRRGRRNA